jgi:hypothetical protein
MMQLLRQSIRRYHDSPPKTARKYLTTKIKKEKKIFQSSMKQKKTDPNNLIHVAEIDRRLLG